MGLRSWLRERRRKKIRKILSRAGVYKPSDKEKGFLKKHIDEAPRVLYEIKDQLTPRELSSILLLLNSLSPEWFKNIETEEYIELLTRAGSRESTERLHEIIERLDFSNVATAIFLLDECKDPSLRDLILKRIAEQLVGMYFEANKIDDLRVYRRSIFKSLSSMDHSRLNQYIDKLTEGKLEIIF